MNSHDYIEKHFENRLTSDEEKEFERLLNTDSDFAEEYAFQKKLKQAIILNEREELKNRLKDFEPEVSKTKTSKFWYVAASIALLFGLGYYFVNNSSSLIYDDYYRTYPNVIAPTVRGEAHSDLKSQAFYEYDAENYQKSQLLFSSLYDRDREDYALFYQAISTMV